MADEVRRQWLFRRAMMIVNRRRFLERRTERWAADDRRTERK